ncbi:hypothetical protein ABPG74_008323 [Tetrahymena malaccensis]
MLNRVLRKFFSSGVERQCTISYLDGKNQGVALVELNNPSKRNALSNKLVADLKEIIHELNSNSNIRVGILRSKTPGMFCAGADLKERLGLSNFQTELLVENLRNTFDALYRVPVPMIAAIDGPALGGGLEMAISCDIRIATKKSLLGLPETALAIIPGAGGTQKLPRLIGVAKAKELIFTAAKLSPQEALELGILNYVEEDYDSAYNKALTIAELILKNGPIGVRAAKAAINLGSEVDLKTGLEIEKMQYTKVANSEDRIEGLKAFAEKRSPVYKGI